MGNAECVLRALKNLVPNWYSIGVVSEFSRLTSDETQDALLELEVLGDVEVDEWEDGLRVRLKEKEEPLTAEQKAVVERWMPLAYKMAMEKYDRKWLTNEELAQHLCCELIVIVKRWRPEESPNFLTYACPSLRGARATWYLDQKHMRGYKRGKKYENVPQMQEMDLDNPDEREEFEAAFCYDDSQEFELRDEILGIFSKLTDKQAEAILLTEYYEMTGDEAAEASGVSRRRLGVAKREGLDVLNGVKEPTEKTAKNSNPDNFQHLLPRLLLGITKQWPSKEEAKKKDRGECPICKDIPLDQFAYCLYCDRWGMDHLAKTTPRLSFMKKTTLKMTKARDKYRTKISA